MNNRSTQEKIGMLIVGLSIIALILDVFEIEKTISEYGKYLAAIGAALWYGGWANRKEAKKEN